MGTPAAAALSALSALSGGDFGALRSSPLLAAALLLLSLLLAALLARCLLAPGPRRDAALLLGPCGAGKTALFGRVRPSKAPFRSTSAP